MIGKPNHLVSTLCVGRKSQDSDGALVLGAKADSWG